MSVQPRWAAQWAGRGHKKTGKQLNGSFSGSRCPRWVSVALRVPPLSRAFASRIAIPRFGRASLLHVVCRVVRSCVACFRSHSLSPSPWCSAAPVHLRCISFTCRHTPERSRLVRHPAPPVLCVQCYVCTCHGAVWLIPARSTRARAVEWPPGVAVCECENCGASPMRLACRPCDGLK